MPPLFPDVVCPICGGAIVETSFGFGCANYRQDDPDSCRFAIGTMAGKDLNAAQVKELLNQGENRNNPWIQVEEREEV